MKVTQITKITEELCVAAFVRCEGAVTSIHSPNAPLARCKLVFSFPCSRRPRE